MTDPARTDAGSTGTAAGSSRADSGSTGAAAGGAGDPRAVTEADLRTLSRQLGRPVRDVVEIGARCVCGNPLVATTAPRLSRGIPFPTTFYLTHPTITAAVSRLEAAGMMAQMSDRLQQDEQLAADYLSAHEAYLDARSEIGARSGVGPVPEIDGVSAGGMPVRVKCLHVLVGHSLAAGPGVNPLGDEALEAIAPWWTSQRCYCEGAWDTAGPVPQTDLSRHVKTQEQRPRTEAAGAEAAGAEAGSRPMRVAAIDCGTNSIRLLIADVHFGDDGGTRLEDVVRLMRVVRLGRGVDATGRLDEQALERTFAAAEEYAALIEEHGAGQVRFVATSATRDAENRQVFVDGIRARLGVAPEVVSGDEEAALSFAGAASVLAPEHPAPILVVDLGGGSTEFVFGDRSGVRAARSVDIGCVRLTERHLRTDPPTPEQKQAAAADVDAAIDEVLGTIPLAEVASVIGVAGSITTVTAHALKLDQYRPEAIHGAELSLAEAKSAARQLLEMSASERSALPYMHPGRVDVIGAGALIWHRTLERLGELTAGRLRTAVTSEHDILDGIALRTAPGS